MSLKIDAIGSAAAGTVNDAATAFRTETGALRIGGEPGIDRAEGALAPSPSIATTEAGGFAAVLEKTAMAASAKEREAVGKAEAFAQGRTDDLHGTMISMKEADISMKLVGSVRDKLMDAWSELWRINV